MSITRAHVAGALKLLNANNIPNRRGHLINMLKAEHSQKDVDKVLRDVESYPEWIARVDLEPKDASAVAAAANEEVIATTAGRVKKSKKAPAPAPDAPSTL